MSTNTATLPVVNVRIGRGAKVHAALHPRGAALCNGRGMNTTSPTADPIDCQRCLAAIAESVAR